MGKFTVGLVPHPTKSVLDSVEIIRGWTTRSQAHLVAMTSDAARVGDGVELVDERTFRERVLGDASGAGTTGLDDRYAARHNEGTGAEIMGAAMFGLHSFPDDPDWKGWWGEEPPFGYPVFVLTGNAPRPPIPMRGGTTFHFRNAAIEEVLADSTGQIVAVVIDFKDDFLDDREVFLAIDQLKFGDDGRVATVTLGDAELEGLPDWDD